MGIVYCLTSPSNKTYIGQTIRNLEKRLKEHEKRSDCLLIYNAIQKYGIENFKCEIIFKEKNDDINLLDLMETSFIEKYNSIYPNGYNIRKGGRNGSKHCKESRERMRLTKLGNKNHNYGKPRSESTKKKISLAKKGEKHHFYGKKFSYEHKLNLSKSHKKYDLPMYLIKLKSRPEHYCSSGYAVLNHPTLKNKYFTSKKFSDQCKLNMAIKYLESANLE